ncbi:hypothetical protein HGH93_02055 [Chitinophaga polysaccharea]|uniref:hypothetical protein n=1 Tax=Chitinophaga polysaccharea TaxID=1293035 RepID=UPI001455A021|nr:hypothetical protein [Chitinophaga polysaccharea]NLR56867.1 hypothetical protein [Chitinophaga polysaccharea]
MMRIFWRKYCIITLLSLLGCLTNGMAQTTQTIYLSQSDTTKNKFIAVLPPTAVKTTGYLLLVPGAFEQPQDVLAQSGIPAVAAQKGILVIIPVLENGNAGLAIDDATQRSLKKMLDYCIQQYQLLGKSLYLGGFSAGGACVMKFAESQVKNNAPVQPKAVFTIDAPLDFERMYQSAQRNLRLAPGGRVNPEQKMIAGWLEQYMQATAKTGTAFFHEVSPYSFSDTTQAAVKLLRNIPVTIYSEPDIEWWMQNRAFDYSTLNAVDGAAMINELHLLGNNNARFIATQGKGYRLPNHNKHPHSWSIADPAEVVNWLLSFQ